MRAIVSGAFSIFIIIAIVLAVLAFFGWALEDRRSEAEKKADEEKKKKEEEKAAKKEKALQEYYKKHEKDFKKHGKKLALAYIIPLAVTIIFIAVALIVAAANGNL
jgi:Flp pilus assembly protein TadB